MARKTRMRRFAECALPAVLALASLVAWAPAGAAQEMEAETLYRWRVEALDARPLLGIWVDPVDDGVRVNRVMEDGPAQAVGIRVDDVIVSVGGHELTEPLEDEEARGYVLVRSPGERLRALVNRVPEGDTVDVTVVRDSRSMTFRVVPEVMFSDGGRWRRLIDVDAWPDSANYRELAEQWRLHTERFRDHYDRIRELPRVYSWDSVHALPSVGSGWHWDGSRWSGSRGLDLVELNPGLGSYFGTEEGVLVADVDDDSPLGLRAGDVVVAIDGRRVAGIARLHRILDSYEEDEEIRFRIWRDGAETTVEGTIN